MYISEEIKIPSYHQCLVEICIDSPLEVDKQYVTVPHIDLFPTKGILIAQGIIQANTNNLIVMIANISAKEVTLEHNQHEGDLEEFDGDTHTCQMMMTEETTKEVVTNQKQYLMI